MLFDLVRSNKRSRYNTKAATHRICQDYWQNDTNMSYLKGSQVLVFLIFSCPFPLKSENWMFNKFALYLSQYFLCIFYCNIFLLIGSILSCRDIHVISCSIISGNIVSCSIVSYRFVSYCLVLYRSNQYDAVPDGDCKRETETIFTFSK